MEAWVIEFLTVADLVRASGLSRQGLHNAIRAGRLVASARTRSGMLLFGADEALRFIKMRGPLTP
jgi:hypothetical protein